MTRSARERTADVPLGWKLRRRVRVQPCGPGRARTCTWPARAPGATTWTATSYAQAAAALRIIVAALQEAGASARDVVGTAAYVTDMADADLVARAHSEVFDEVRPAATMVAVSALLDPRMRVEIEAYAIVPEA